MNILGCLFFVSLGILIIVSVFKILKEKKDDYSKYPVTTCKVLHQEDLIGRRWTVSFLDENGKELLGMDNIISSTTFFSEKYTIPKFGKEEQIYYWKHNEKSQHSINNKKIDYYIHFCNENLYSLEIAKFKRYKIISIFIGLFLIICGIIILL